MICKYCNSVIADDSAFCTNCGQKVEKVAPAPQPGVCSACGAPVAPGSAFCTNCGQKIVASAAAPAPAPQPSVCTACGAALEPGAAFCTNCGATVTAPKKQISKKALLGIIAGGIGAVLIGLIILLISLLSGSSEEDIVDLYFQASCYADVDAAMDCMPPEMNEIAMEFYDDEEDYVDSIKSDLEDALEDAEDEYGKFKSYEFKIVDEEEYDLDDMGMLLKMLDMDIASAKEIEVEYTLVFKDETIEDSISMILIEVDGSWYMIESEDLF